MQKYKPGRRKFLKHAAGSAMAAAVVGPTLGAVAVVVLVGISVGALGSTLALRRFLEV